MEKKNSLTEQEEKDLKEFRERYLGYGLCTKPAKKKCAEEAICKLVEDGTPEIRWYESPLACHKAITKQLNTPDQFYYPRFGGQFEAYWIAFYQFAHHIGVEWGNEDAELQDELDTWDALCQSTNLFWYNDQICFMSNRPKEINMLDGSLHKDGGAAILYRDGWAIYSLHGVRVPEWLAVTPAGKIDCKRIADISNAEIRREFVHKVGYERILYDLGGKVLDKVEIPISNGTVDFEHVYELVELNLDTRTKWRLLKMVNPSLSSADNVIYHLEGVPDSCSTVKAALQFRKPEDFKRYPVDNNGSSWYQQGDVIIYPNDVVPVKPYPDILT